MHRGFTAEVDICAKTFASVYYTVVIKSIEPFQYFGFYQFVILYSLSSFREIYKLCYALSEYNEKVLLH